MRALRAPSGAVRNGVLEELFVVVLGGDIAVEKDVGVEVDEAGKNGGVREVDRFDAGRWRAAGRYGNDFISFDKDQDVIERIVALAVDHMPGANGYTLC
jgi:hypothetical protein